MAAVKLLGGLRNKVGAERLDVDAATVRELLDALVARGGEALTVLFFDDPRARSPEPHRDLRVLVNGRSIVFLRGLETGVESEDTVTVHLSGARGYPGG